MKQALVILCGIPFSGKSTLATRLAHDINFQRIDLDEVKSELLGQTIQDENISQSDWDSIYQKMYDIIRDTLSRGLGVIHDTGNFTKYERGLVRKIAEDLNIPFITVFIDTPISVAKTRMLANRQTKKRFDITDEAFESAVKEMEAPVEDENPLTFDDKASYEEILWSLKPLMGTQV